MSPTTGMDEAPQPARYPRFRKIAIVGSRSVGKSTLATRYIDGQFNEEYFPTIENTFNKNIVIKGQEFSVEVIDTAGQDEYSVLSSRHLIGVHGYMLVYSVGSHNSFDMCQVLRDKIVGALGTDTVPIIFVGNKKDLPAHQREVKSQDGKRLQEQLSCAWIEASARHNENVDRAFELLITEIEKVENPEPTPPKRPCILM